MFDYRMDHIFSYEATLSEPEIIGPVPEGIRANFYVTGGRFNGPEMNGTLRAVGADWLTIRRDGVGVLDVRATLETGDGALIYMTYSGITDLGENGHDNFLQGQIPTRLQLRTVPRFQSSHPDYAWLNRIQAFSVGEANLETSTVYYDVYAAR